MRMPDAVRFVPQIADPVELAIFDQLGNALQQQRFVDLVGELGDDDLKAVAARRLLDEGLGANDHPSAPCGVGRADSFGAEDRSTGREIRTGNELHQFVDGRIRIFDEIGDCVAKLVQIVGRDVGRHADGNTGRAIEQQIRQAAGQHARLGHRRVVVRNEIDRVLVDVEQELVGDQRQPRLGVPHGRGAITIDRAEVALTVDEGVTQVEWLRHTDQGVVNRTVAVWVEVLHHLADGTGALAVTGGRAHAHFPHREEHTAVNRLQSVSGIGKRALHDDAHRVVEIRLPHFGIDVR